jgi:DNA-binding MarR family transcriptional regulator
MNENKKLNLIYNNNSVIVSAGFTMKSNYIVPLLSRMVDEGLINKSAETVVQFILQYKHGAENPFPSRDEIARVLGKSVSYVKKALKSIKDAGILFIEKVGRKNTYNFKPFFALLEKFIVEIKEKHNYDVKISELLNVKVDKKEDQDFSWTENYDSEKETASEETAEEKEEGKTEDQSEKVIPTIEKLPESIQKVIKLYNIDEKGIVAICEAYNTYGKELPEKVYIDKILCSVGKNSFENYFKACIVNASSNNEQSKQINQSKQQPYTNHKYNYKPKQQKIIRKEPVPNWMQDQKKSESIDEAFLKMSKNELLEQKSLLEYMLNGKTNLSKNPELKEKLDIINSLLEEEVI